MKACGVGGGLLLLAGLLLAAPLWWAGAPAMPDYPAHLAAFHLIGGGDGGGYYRVAWTFVPNLASELAVPLLARFMPLAIAARLFLTIALLLWVLGGGAVHRALYGRTGIAPLLGAAFAYNGNFFWGFFNYYFAAGLSLVLFATWIAHPRPSPLRLLLFAAAVTLLYACHIFAAATLAVMLAGYETAETLRSRAGTGDFLRRALRAGAMFLPAALCFLLLAPHGAEGAGLQFNLADTMLDRFESLLLYHFDAPSYAVPIGLGAGLLLLLATGRARLHPAMWGVLALLLLGSLLAPEMAMGGWAVHLRLPALFAVLLFASAEIRLPPVPRTLIAGAALAGLAALAAALVRDWQAFSRETREWRAALARLPRHVRLMTVLDGDALGDAADQPYWHLAEDAITDRAGFTPLMFATRGQHVIRIVPPYDRYAAATAEQGSPPDIGELDDLAAGNSADDPDIRTVFPYLLRFPCHFDMALVIHLGGRQTPAPAMLRRHADGSFFTLYDIRPGAACGRP